MIITTYCIRVLRIEARSTLKKVYWMNDVIWNRRNEFNLTLKEWTNYDETIAWWQAILVFDSLFSHFGIRYCILSCRKLDWWFIGDQFLDLAMFTIRHSATFDSYYKQKTGTFNLKNPEPSQKYFCIMFALRGSELTQRSDRDRAKLYKQYIMGIDSK